MEKSHAYNHFRTQVEPALTSKLDEFLLLGYESVTENELWDYLLRKKWKKVKEDIMLYEIVADILTIKVSDFISFTTIDTYKNHEFSFDNEDDLRELLK